MGLPLSFQVLCLAHYFCCEWGTSRLSNRKYSIFGDDFVANWTDNDYAIYCKNLESLGFKVNVSKTATTQKYTRFIGEFFTRSKENVRWLPRPRISSLIKITSERIDDVNFVPEVLRITPTYNLIYSLSNSRQQKLLFSYLKSLKAYKMLKKANVPLHEPHSLGGAGLLPLVKSYNHETRRLAAAIKYCKPEDRAPFLMQLKMLWKTISFSSPITSKIAMMSRRIEPNLNNHAHLIKESTVKDFAIAAITSQGSLDPKISKIGTKGNRLFKEFKEKRKQIIYNFFIFTKNKQRYLSDQATEKLIKFLDRERYIASEAAVRIMSDYEPNYLVTLDSGKLQNVNYRQLFGDYPFMANWEAKGRREKIRSFLESQ